MLIGYSLAHQTESTQVIKIVKKDRLSKKNYFLCVEKIPSASPAFPAYFVGSTAPNNVEDNRIGDVEDPQGEIDSIAAFLSEKDYPEILVAVHGYNTALGSFGTVDAPGDGTKGWYQDIRDHIEQRCDRKADGLVLIGYRWPSEQVDGRGSDTLKNKISYAFQSLPKALKVLLCAALAMLAAMILWVLIDDTFPSIGFEVVSVVVFVLMTFLASIVFTLFLLRVVGYFRDSYRASNFGVPDLVELIRQLDKAVEASPRWSKGPQARRIRLSFIGHSMGGFVVTNTVRILSDVFDPSAVGKLDAGDKAKIPSSNIGHVFSLGRLVLVSPDIPAEAIISSRANFLSSALRRFEETYLFSNEGDMALKLASTAANYASFPANTLEGGYRLGNVVVRSPLKDSQNEGNRKDKPRYGIVNLDADAAEGEQMIDMKPRENGKGGVEPTTTDYRTKTGEVIGVSSFLEYLYTLEDTPLSYRQRDILAVGQKPIAELFTVFDCTDYYEFLAAEDGKKLKKVSLLSYGLGKRSLSFTDCARLVLATVTGEIDTHGGYFFAGDSGKSRPKKPEAYATKELIYGLACLGFRPLLASLADERRDADPISVTQQELQTLSKLCESRNIQVLLAAERYNRDVLGIVNEGDRNGY